MGKDSREGGCFQPYICLFPPSLGRRQGSSVVWRNLVAAPLCDADQLARRPFDSFFYRNRALNSSCSGCCGWITSILWALHMASSCATKVHLQALSGWHIHGWGLRGPHAWLPWLHVSLFCFPAGEVSTGRLLGVASPTSPHMLCQSALSAPLLHPASPSNFYLQFLCCEHKKGRQKQWKTLGVPHRWNSGQWIAWINEVHKRVYAVGKV